MLSWLSENAATLLIAAGLLAAVALIIRAVVRGKVVCSGDCASCGGHGADCCAGCSRCGGEKTQP